MSKFLTIEHLRKKTGIKLVSAAIPTFTDSGRTYAALEQESESKTHREMRIHAIGYFEKLGYQIYPEGIGVEGTFALADFLAYRDGRIVFVECLTDAKATQHDIERKMQLSQFGEVCFVVVGGHGCRWENEKRTIPVIFQKLARETDVLTYQYGHWQNGFEKGVENLTWFPRVLFSVGRTDRIRLRITVKTKAKTADFRFDFKTEPLVLEEGQELLLDIACRLAWQIYGWQKYSTPAKFAMRSASGKIFKDKNGKLVAQICLNDGTGWLKVRGQEGLKVMEHFLAELGKTDLVVEIDKQALEKARRILSEVVEKRSTNRTAKPDPIQSNLYETSQIVWVINHFFRNGPTKASKFIHYLPEAIVRQLSYWLRRGVEFGDLKQVGSPNRLVVERVYAATDSGLERVRRDLSTVRYGEIPGKGRPYKIVSYVRHGKHLECPAGEM